MEVHDWITITSVIIAGAGWFVNGWLSRRHEIAKRRMDFRLNALCSFLPVLFAIKEDRTQDDRFARDIAACRTNFQLYCFGNEVEEFEKLITAIESKQHKNFKESLLKVTHMVRNQVRKQLGLDEFMPKKSPGGSSSCSRSSCGS